MGARGAAERTGGGGGAGGSEDTSCYTSKHPTSSADVTEIGEKKREKKKKCHTAALLYALLRLMQHFKQGSSSMHEQHVIVEKGFGLFFFKSQTTRLPLTSIYTFKKKKKKKRAVVDAECRGCGKKSSPACISVWINYQIDYIWYET